MATRDGIAGAALLVAAGVLAIAAARRAASPPMAPGVPASVERIIRRHVSGNDFEGFAGAVRKHVAAGHPLTRAALGMLAAVWFEPPAVAAIKRDLKAAGF